MIWLNIGFRGIKYHEFDLTAPNLTARIKDLVARLPPIDTFIYSAGIYQQGLLTDLSDEQVEEMLDVCGRGLIYFCKYLLDRQAELAEFIVITSSTQYKPQRLEPVYSFTKAGEGHFANSLAEDGRIKKVLVVSPSGTKTEFWRDIKHPEWGNFLDPAWVTKQIMEARAGKYQYKFLKIFRSPPKVEIVETR